MGKIVVTHFRPDLDALASIWLIKKFFPGWEKAKVEFVPAGETFRGAPADEEPEILHVDTGLGKLDHHERRQLNCAANLCLEKILKEERIGKIDQEALKRLVAVVTEVDNGRDISWPEATGDRYEFMFHNFFENSLPTEKALEFGLTILDKIYQGLKNKVKAEKILKEEGRVFKSKWGKAVAVETGNDQVLQVGEKEGFALVAKKSPKTGHLRIYGRWDKKIDLTKAFEDFKKKDPGATWYLHPSRCLLLNGAMSNPQMKPTKLSLSAIIKILKKA